MLFLKSRTWQKRRVVVTREMIAFVNPGENAIVDRIYLKDVELAHDMSKFNSGVDGAKFVDAIMITTLPEGYNGGRTYYFQADSKQDCIDLTYRLAKLSRSAARRAEASTVIAKIRLWCRVVFHSPAFQGTSALLILAVSNMQNQFSNMFLNSWSFA